MASKAASANSSLILKLVGPNLVIPTPIIVTSLMIFPHDEQVISVVSWLLVPPIKKVLFQTVSQFPS